MARLPCLLPCLLLAACKFGDDNASQVDAGIDGPVAGSEHVLFTEVKSTFPAAAPNDEFIELWNPTNRDIALDDYYLSDFNEYWRYPQKNLTSIQADFLVRFPAGALIRSNEVITIAMNHDGFVASFAKAPTYAANLDVDNATSGAKAFRDRLVNVTQAPGITDSGEYLTLFYWDGAGDTIKDVDAMVSAVASDVTAANRRVNKAAVDGIDPDGTATPYKTDDGQYGGGMNDTIPSALPARSYKRRKREAGAETQVGSGNGLNGDDETSELLKVTWDGDATTPHSAPTPGTVLTF